MATLSVPLSDEVTKKIEELVKEGKASNKAEIVRQALNKYLEDQAVQDVLDAMKEPGLKGNIRDLASKL